MKRQALGWFAAAALVTAIGSADPAHAKRFGRFDTTDAETKAYCRPAAFNALQKKHQLARIYRPTVGPALAIGFVRSIFEDLMKRFITATAAAALLAAPANAQSFKQIGLHLASPPWFLCSSKR